MSEINKKTLTERDICTKFINPTVEAAGWDLVRQIREQYLFTDGQVPLPPLAEQKRIVAKVTELLSLCDTLEAQFQTTESASSQLLSAAVQHLLQPRP